MNAIVSGRSGRALIIEGESLKSFDVDDPSRIVPRQKADLPYLFGDAADLRILENTSLESVERELRNERNFTWALDLTLISLDGEQAKDIRREAIVELEYLFASTRTIEQVENVLYAKALPEAADFIGALRLCGTRKTYFELLSRLVKSQSMISFISSAWESLEIALFGSSEYRNEFKAVAVREGLFRTLVLDPFSDASNPSIQKLPDHKKIIRAWKNQLVVMALGDENLGKLARKVKKARIEPLEEAREKEIKRNELRRKM